MDYRIDFAAREWESPLPGIRHKVSDQGGCRLRLVEYARAMEPHWCAVGHVGIILEGRMEIEFDGETLVLEAGDGVHIPDGEAHRHRARVLSDTVTALFVETAP